MGAAWTVPHSVQVTVGGLPGCSSRLSDILTTRLAAPAPSQVIWPVWPQPLQTSSCMNWSAMCAPALLPCFQRQHGINGCSVAHEWCGVGLWVAVLVERPGGPGARFLILVGQEPG